MGLGHYFGTQLLIVQLHLQCIWFHTSWLGYSTAILLWITHLHTCGVHQFSMCIMWHHTTLACRYNAKLKSTKYFVHSHLEKSSKHNIWHKLSSHTIVSQWQFIQSITSISTLWWLLQMHIARILLSQCWICYRASGIFFLLLWHMHHWNVE